MPHCIVSYIVRGNPILTFQCRVVDISQEINLSYKFIVRGPQNKKNMAYLENNKTPLFNIFLRYIVQ